MPDSRTLGAEERRSRREEPYRKMLENLPEKLPQTDPQAIAACELCDADGYRGARVCDHVDYREISARGHALASQALVDAKARRAAEAAEKHA